MTRKKSAVPPAPVPALDAGRFLHDIQAQMARSLLAEPEKIVALADDIASTANGGEPDEELCDLLTMALDEARMAQEGGQRAGKRCLDALSRHLADMSRKGEITIRGNMAITRCYVRANLAVPDIAPGAQSVRQEASFLAGDEGRGDEGRDPVAVFVDSLGDLVKNVDDDPSMLHHVFAETLPGIPPDARRMVCRIAAANPDPHFEPLGCAWLLDSSEPVRAGAAEGLGDRIAAGHLSASALGRLAMLRTWIVDEPHRRCVDGLIRQAIRSGVPSEPADVPRYRITGCVSSPVDGAGAQSLGIGLQRGRSRSIAVVLLKQGFGVKDAYAAPCDSVAEQRGILQQMAGPGEEGRVSLDYVRTALRVALADGIRNGVYPAPGLIDVVDVCALSDLRPADDSSPAGLLGQYDAEERLRSLSADARDKLVAASGEWAAIYPVLGSWFEDSDDMFDAIGAGASAAARKKALWTWLETRRAFWSSIVMRTALLLQDRGDPMADSFAVTACEISGDRPLRRIPVMSAIADQTLEARSAAGAPAGDGMPLDFDEALMDFLMNAVAAAPAATRGPSRGRKTRSPAPRKRK
ncbi:hypothetical protein [Nguyenibacter vanlangensis]|uniref:Uncharacterized protein n=1 Tax=Nguyenibacter vanlangensis TaxID=1216886 RepID=A0A7Y7IVN1_9PROT|nr:hypothetical protein [Nguyenibacter vanlangensis]NVN10606.1 hypothetical protein [Nguyenibacter vanlangensis]